MRGSASHHLYDGGQEPQGRATKLAKAQSAVLDLVEIPNMFLEPENMSLGLENRSLELCNMSLSLENRSFLLLKIS